MASLNKMIKNRHYSYFFPVYTTVPDESEHVKKLKFTKVKLIWASSDMPPRMLIAFCDDHSLELLRSLREALTKFYQTFGHDWEKPLDNLKVGEIIVAKRIDETIHRVVVMKVQKNSGTGDVKVITLGIDDGVKTFITKAWLLKGSFHTYPRQVTTAIISNLDDMHPKRIFEKFSENESELKQVLDEVTLKVIRSLTSKTSKCLMLSDIKDVYNADGVALPEISGKIHMNQNAFLRPYFMEKFKEYCLPIQPEVGSTGYGIITDTTRKGDFGLCPNEKLINLINGYINSNEMWEKANNITDEARKDLASKASSGECRNFLIVNLDKTRIFRGELDSVSGNTMKMFLQDAGRFVPIDANHLVCALDENPDLPSLLLMIPPQAYRLQMHRIMFINKSQRKRLGGMRVKFNVVKSSGLYQVELFNALGESINQMLLDDGANFP